MSKTSKYEAKTPDADGNVRYTPNEHSVWRDLYVRQYPNVVAHASADFMQGFEALGLPDDRVPRCSDVSERLTELTGWRVAPVPALIPFDEFFGLLSQRVFPAASFIRSRDDFDYVEEPDIFHEIFGHAPLLADQRYADFLHAVGVAGVNASKEDYVWLARLNWFTIEFGLIRENNEVRALGAGIASSPAELAYAIHSDEPERKPFDLIEALRTPYRIDIPQPIYFVLNHADTLAEISERDLLGDVRLARELGMRLPTYPPKEQVA